MAVEGVLVEAHSYSGGLRHTPFAAGAARPAWAPPAETVGWRDDFEFESGDAIVEYSQRSHSGETIGWLAIYRRSTDARFGDRSNHAGIGVWLRGRRICDAGSLLLALDKLVGVLSGTPDPQAIASDVEAFDSARFLGSYLVAADKLPRDWRGAPASPSTLVDTRYFIAHAPQFSAAINDVAEAITRLSIGWGEMAGTPRSIILVTPRTAVPVGRDFAALEPAGGLIADLLEKVPNAFAEEREAVRQAEADLEVSKTLWEQSRAAQQSQLAADRSAMQKLDGQPPTLEGIAARLNILSRQMSEFRSGSTPTADRAEMPAARHAANHQDIPRSNDQRTATAYPAKKRPAPEVLEQNDRGGEAILMVILSVLVAAIIGALLYWYFHGF